jgi:hypothetical protein
MNAVISCDEVFDILTRGPFPSGAADDCYVDEHLRVCHECRQLAEALRPAVGLFHESIPEADEGSLPSYGGALAQAIRGETICLQHAPYVFLAKNGGTSIAPRTIAFSMLSCLALGLLLMYCVNTRVTSAPVATTARTSNNARLSNQIHPTLASFDISLACLTKHDEGVNLGQMRTANLPLTPGERQEFLCCTRCHYSGAKTVLSTSAMQNVMLACASCHRVNA